MRQTTPGAIGPGGGFDFSSMEEAHFEDYLLMRLTAYQQVEMDLGVELTMSTYSMSPGEYLMIAAGLQWMTETEAGNEFARDAGITIGGAAITYVVARKLGLTRALGTLFEGVGNRIAALAAEITDSRAAREIAQWRATRAATRRALGFGGASRLAQEEAQAFAGRLGRAVASPRDLPSMAAVAVDRRTGQMFHGISLGNKPGLKPSIHPQLQQLMDNASRSKPWEFWNCAEFNAVNRALHSGASMDDIVVTTVRARPYVRGGAVIPAGTPVPRCSQCFDVLGGVTYVCH
jgi:hypothetical protein